MHKDGAVTGTSSAPEESMYANCMEIIIQDCPGFGVRRTISEKPAVTGRAVETAGRCVVAQSVLFFRGRASV